MNPQTLYLQRSRLPLALLWGAAVAGAIFTLSGLASRSVVTLRRRSHRRKMDQQRSLRGLQSAVIGNSKSNVSRVLGPPRATSARPGEVATGASAYWQADVWYYPLAPRQQVALAIHFDDDCAHSVEIVTTPEPALKQG